MSQAAQAHGATGSLWSSDLKLKLCGTSVCLLEKQYAMFQHVTRNESHTAVFCCFLCLLCRFGAIPAGICERTAGGGSIKKRGGCTLQNDHCSFDGAKSPQIFTRNFETQPGPSSKIGPVIGSSLVPKYHQLADICGAEVQFFSLSDPLTKNIDIGNCATRPNFKHCCMLMPCTNQILPNDFPIAIVRLMINRKVD